MSTDTIDVMDLFVRQVSALISETAEVLAEAGGGSILQMEARF